MREVDEKKIARITVGFSLALHCLVLSVPGLQLNLDPDKPDSEDVYINLEIERPPLLPKIDVMAEEKKVKEIEPEEVPPVMEEDPLPEQAEVIHKIEPVVEDKIKESIVKEDGPFSVIEEVSKEETHLEPNREPPPPVKENLEVLNPDDEAMLRYQDMVKQKIESCRRYPSWARKQEFEGISCVTFILLANGSIKDISQVYSSGFKILDKEAISTVERAGPFKPIPKKFHCSYITIKVALVFQLR